MTAMTALKSYTKKTNPLLLEIFKDKKSKLPASLETAHQMLDKLESFCVNGGKRLRPALVYFGYQLFDGDESKDIIKVSLAVELVHAFLLIHDDIIDQSDLRRGRPTIHKLYESEYKLANNSASDPTKASRFGETMAILVGDLAFSLAFEVLLASDFSPNQKTEISKKLSETITNTVFGQDLDIRLETRGLSKGSKGSSKLSEILDVYSLKTGQYTFESPLYIGAFLAGASQDDLKIISDYAIPAGIAFQIKDDILGMFGDVNKTGAIIGSDLKQGKQTLLIARALEKANKVDKAKLEAAIGNKKLTKKELTEALKIIDQTGALRFAKNLTQEYISQARQSLEKFSQRGWNSDIIQQLEDILEFIVQRKK